MENKALIASSPLKSPYWDKKYGLEFRIKNRILHEGQIADAIIAENGKSKTWWVGQHGKSRCQ